MSSTPHSDTTTAGIRVRAAAEFLRPETLPPEQRTFENSEKPRYVFRYRIQLTNVGERSARLLSRHWVILDGEGRREDVRGRGVVGEFPKLAPGETYAYTSHCPLATKWGTMEGSYEFEREDGTRFQVRIGRFFLVPTAPRLQIESESSGDR